MEVVLVDPVLQIANPESTDFFDGSRLMVAGLRRRRHHRWCCRCVLYMHLCLRARYPLHYSLSLSLSLSLKASVLKKGEASVKTVTPQRCRFCYCVCKHLNCFVPPLHNFFPFFFKFLTADSTL